jgi:hypothetical protein
MPDSRSVYFTGIEANGVRRGYVQNLSRGLPRPITPESTSVIAVSPDGSQVTYRFRDRLMVKSTDATEGRFVARIPKDDYLLRWTADARALLVAEADTSIRIYRLDLGRGTRTLWKTVGIADRAGFICTGLVVSADASACAINYSRVLGDLYLVEGLK